MFSSFRVQQFLPVFRHNSLSIQLQRQVNGVKQWHIHKFAKGREGEGAKIIYDVKIREDLKLSV